MGNARNYKVLVVDDEDYILESIEIILKTEGFDVFSVDSGEKALKVLRETNIDVVLTDIKMPEMDGITLLKKIKDEFQVEVILITGFPSIDTAVESVKFGAYDYIIKPFKVEDLLNKVLKAIENKDLKREVVDLHHIISIYESSKFFRNILSVNEIFEKMNTVILNFLKNDGYFIKLFTNNYIKQVNVDQNFEKYINDNFTYKDYLSIFLSLEYYYTTVKLNGKDLNILLLPMKSRDGLWGIIGVFREGSKGYSDLDCKIHVIYVEQFSLSLLNIYSFEDLSKGYLETITALSNAVDAKDHYTLGHSENVKRYSLMIVNEMGLNDEFKETMTYAGLLHDIGKIGVPTEIIVKPSKLTNEEYDEMKKHPIYGKDILSPIEFLGDVPYYVLCHHEKMDGSGYPYGLTAEDIPLGAKILQVADSYDAMTTDRSYRLRRDAKLAFEELDRCTGTQFDKEVVAAFKSAMRKKKHLI